MPKRTTWGQTLEVWTNTSYRVVSNQTSFLPYKDQHSTGCGVCRDPSHTHMENLLPLLVNQFWKLTNPITILLQESHWLKPSFPLDRVRVSTEHPTFLIPFAAVIFTIFVYANYGLSNTLSKCFMSMSSFEHPTILDFKYHSLLFW